MVNSMWQLEEESMQHVRSPGLGKSGALLAARVPPRSSTRRDFDCRVLGAFLEHPGAPSTPNKSIIHLVSQHAMREAKSFSVRRFSC